MGSSVIQACFKSAINPKKARNVCIDRSHICTFLNLESVSVTERLDGALSTGGGMHERYPSPTQSLLYPNSHIVPHKYSF